MQISLDTSTASAGELTALIALLASLGGRLPTTAGHAPHAEDDAFRRGLQAARTAAARAGDEQSDEPTATGEDSEPLDPAELDSTGVPWDARIHSTPPSINKSDGTYRKKRKVDEVTFGRIHGELSELAANANPTTGTTTSGEASPQSGTAATPDAPAPPGDDEAPPPPADDGPLADGAESAPTADKSAASDAAASATGAGKFAGFPEFVGAVNAIRPAPGIPYAELNAFAATVGVPGGFKDMRLHPALWEDFFALAGGE